MKTRKVSRKNRKTIRRRNRIRKIRGGAPPQIRTCNLNESDMQCLSRFLTIDGLEIQRVPPDGNCFFHAMATFFKNNGYGNFNNDDLYKRLRSIMYEYLKSNNGFEAYKKFISNDISIYNKIIDPLQKDKHWSGDVNDIVIKAMADYYNSIIIIYDLKKYNKQPSQLIIYTFNPEGHKESPNMTVKLLRTNDSHFDLLNDEINMNNFNYSNYSNFNLNKALKNNNSSFNLGAHLKGENISKFNAKKYENSLNMRKYKL